jgi:sulfur relay (sulfurtransferase) DsrC/TusE family protein
MLKELTWQQRRISAKHAQIRSNFKQYEQEIREEIALEIESLLDENHWKMVGCCHSCVAIRRAVEIVRGL